jgi:hypothetical protein
METDMQQGSIDRRKQGCTPSIHPFIYLSTSVAAELNKIEQGGVERSLVDLSSYLTCIHLEKIVMDNSIRSRERSELS